MDSKSEAQMLSLATPLRDIFLRSKDCLPWIF